MSVYFVTCREANAVKIGFSLDPHGRLPEIQWGCPLPLVLEAVRPGKVEDERTLHMRFVDDRIRGEWFTITPMIEAMIAASPAPPPPDRTKAPGSRERRRMRGYIKGRRLLRELEALA